MFAATLASVILVTMTALMFNKSSSGQYTGSQTAADAASAGVSSAEASILSAGQNVLCQTSGIGPDNSAADTARWYVRIVGYADDPVSNKYAATSACSTDSGTAATTRTGAAPRYWIITSTGVSKQSSARTIRVVWDSANPGTRPRFVGSSYGIKSTQIPKIAN